MSETPAAMTHCVFFSLKDNSAENCQALVDDCYRLLTRPEGLISLHAGVRDPELARPVNDQTFDVALITVFESRAAHDAYQTHPDHVEFLSSNKESWSAVRVFDAAAKG